jgi:hypothetical protein
MVESVDPVGKQRNARLSDLACFAPANSPLL